MQTHSGTIQILFPIYDYFLNESNMAWIKSDCIVKQIVIVKY